VLEDVVAVMAVPLAPVSSVEQTMADPDELVGGRAQSRGG
jgi:hypothetical protein